MNVTKALAIAYNIHSNQFDKGGMPYILHPIRVMEAMPKHEDYQVVALLHDTIEDSLIDINKRMSEMLTPIQYEALSLLTKPNNGSYFEYIEKLKHNPIARCVKIADIKDNSNLLRLNFTDIRMADMNRIIKYSKALKILIEFEYMDNLKVNE